MTTSTIHGLHARLRQIPKIIERRLIRLVLRERPRHRGAILLPGRRQSDVIPPHSLFDQTIGVFEDSENLFSPGIIVENDQDRPGVTYFEVVFHLRVH